ncbi:molybdopterin molybdotransferase MoeA [Shimia ponticola]|uniref:molybdopterin molybdotransferase MoeA n=1 Tax=Shimia ponticola TaxID=2582893 RepID=UPI0011BD659E|nr:gephyrin-like molybdotransferase Glp [Shimia ponticola]
MISVTEALDALFALAEPLNIETVGLRAANGRVLAQTVHARRTQPPFSASAMDGYAVRSVDADEGAVLTVIGEAAAGHAYAGSLGAGEAVRIFTGAPLPAGADQIVIQEDTTRTGDTITVTFQGTKGDHVRPAGGDFAEGTALDAPRRLRPNDIALLAAMNIAEVPVTRRPKVAIMATGDELVMPGESPGPDQIIASNSFGLEAMLRNAGAETRMLPIARDTADSLESAFRFARGADLVITIGGASVGDHDLVGPVAEKLGMDRSFYKIAMRPGKPLMAGRLGRQMMIGLPGNPVSAMVCGQVFVRPVIDVMLGLPAQAATRLAAPLAHDIPANGPREHYMRAVIKDGALTVFERQDSSLLSVLSNANALAIRPPKDEARKAGDVLDYLPLS